MDALILKLQQNMIEQKGWALLRYLHLRNFVKSKSSQVSDICVVGSGKGLAELAIAAEFPEAQFYLTDIVLEGRPRRPNYFQCMEISERWGINNIRFGVWDVLKPKRKKHEAVVSTEVLEHIHEHRLAVRNMVSHSLKYTYILAPFASKAKNQDPEARALAYNTHEHVVCGFDVDYFEEFKYNAESIYGTYWTGKNSYRAIVNQAARDGVHVEHATLIEAAKRDIVQAPPAEGKSLGIKCIYCL